MPQDLGSMFDHFSSLSMKGLLLQIRLLLHGHLKADIAEFYVILNASTDPYNTTEKLEIEWNAVTFEWTNGN